MKKHRVIPVLFLRNGFLVQSKQFKRYQNLGNPVSAVKRLSEWGSDELVYLDISRDDNHDMRRDDLGHANRSSVLDIIEDVSKNAFMPITVGGRIRSMRDIEQRLALGADKISINTMALDQPEFITQAAREFGAQCIVVSIDVRLEEDGVHRVRRDGNREATGLTATGWAKRVEELGAGEILLNSIDRDGMKNGYDLPLLDAVSSAVRIPVIGCGGVGEWEHLAQGLQQTKADAVAAGNIFHYSDQSVYLARKHLFGAGLNVRSPELLEF
jgi:cyclase